MKAPIMTAITTATKAVTLLAAATAAISLSATALANNWTEADGLFAQRENNRAAIAQAREKYLAILDASTSAGDKVRAASQLGRLAIYEGEMLLPRGPANQPLHPNWKARAKIFADCWGGDEVDVGAVGFINKISPAALGGQRHEAYYFFRGACAAWWGEAVTQSRAVAQVTVLVDLMRKGLSPDSGDTRFEGGAAYRLAAGVYSNPAARAVDPALYNPALAEEMIRNALGAPEYPGQGYQGDTFYENYRGLGDVLLAQGRKADAKAAYQSCATTVQDAVDADVIPVGRGPEARWVLDQCRSAADAIL